MVFIVQQPGGPTEQEAHVIGADRQIRVDTTTGSLRLHDGQTPGGVEIPSIDRVRGLLTSSNDGTNAAKVVYFSTETELAESTPEVNTLAVLGESGKEDLFIWRNEANDGGGIDSQIQGYWKRIDSRVGFWVRLWRAGLINLQIDGAEPDSDQDTTAWLDNGAIKLWDGADYLAAEPELFARLLRKIGAYDSLGALPDRLADTLVAAADLNAVTDTGWYKSSAADANAPTTTVSTVFHSKIDSNTMTQVFYLQGSVGRDSYVRFKTAGVWGTWTLVPGVLADRLAAVSAVVTDCNNAIDSGFYRIASGGSNMPVAQNGVLFSNRYSATEAAQVFVSTASSGALYTRRYTASAWQAWVRIGAHTTAKTTPILADKVLGYDSASSDAPVVSTWTQIIAALGASAADYRANTADKLLVSDDLWAANAWVNLGATLNGNLALNFSDFLKGYGTATNNITFNTHTGLKEQSGIITITASGGTRTVSFTTANFCTPNNVALGTIASGKAVAFSYYKEQNGKCCLIRLGEVA